MNSRMRQEQTMRSFASLLTVDHRRAPRPRQRQPGKDESDAIASENNANGKEDEIGSSPMLRGFLSSYSSGRGAMGCTLPSLSGAPAACSGRCSGRCDGSGSGSHRTARESEESLPTQLLRNFLRKPNPCPPLPSKLRGKKKLQARRRSSGGKFGRRRSATSADTPNTTGSATGSRAGSVGSGGAMRRRSSFESLGMAAAAAAAAAAFDDAAQADADAAAGGAAAGGSPGDAEVTRKGSGSGGSGKKERPERRRSSGLDMMAAAAMVAAVEEEKLQTDALEQAEQNNHNKKQSDGAMPNSCSCSSGPSGNSPSGPSISLPELMSRPLHCSTEPSAAASPPQPGNSKSTAPAGPSMDVSQAPHLLNHNLSRTIHTLLSSRITSHLNTLVRKSVIKSQGRCSSNGLAGVLGHDVGTYDVDLGEEDRWDFGAGRSTSQVWNYNRPAVAEAADATTERKEKVVADGTMKVDDGDGGDSSTMDAEESSSSGSKGARGRAGNGGNNFLTFSSRPLHTNSLNPSSILSGSGSGDGTADVRKVRAERAERAAAELRRCSTRLRPTRRRVAVDITRTVTSFDVPAGAVSRVERKRVRGGGGGGVGGEAIHADHAEEDAMDTEGEPADGATDEQQEAGKVTVVTNVTLPVTFAAIVTAEIGGRGGGEGSHGVPLDLELGCHGTVTGTFRGSSSNCLLLSMSVELDTEALHACMVEQVRGAVRRAVRASLDRTSRSPSAVHPQHSTSAQAAAATAAQRRRSSLASVASSIAESAPNLGVGEGSCPRARNAVAMLRRASLSSLPESNDWRAQQQQQALPPHTNMPRRSSELATRRGSLASVSSLGDPGDIGFGLDNAPAPLAPTAAQHPSNKARRLSLASTASASTVGSNFRDAFGRLGTNDENEERYEGRRRASMDHARRLTLGLGGSGGRATMGGRAAGGEREEDSRRRASMDFARRLSMQGGGGGGGGADGGGPSRVAASEAVPTSLDIPTRLSALSPAASCNARRVGVQAGGGDGGPSSRAAAASGTIPTSLDIPTRLSALSPAAPCKPPVAKGPGGVGAAAGQRAQQPFQQSALSSGGVLQMMMQQQQQQFAAGGLNGVLGAAAGVTASAPHGHLVGDNTNTSTADLMNNLMNHAVAAQEILGTGGANLNGSGTTSWSSTSSMQLLDEASLRRLSM